MNLPRPLILLSVLLATASSATALQLTADDFVLEWADEGSSSFQSGSSPVLRGTSAVATRFRITVPEEAAGYWGFLVGQVFVTDQSALSVDELAALGTFADPATHDVEISQTTLPSAGGLPAPMRGWTEPNSVSILPAAQWGATMAGVLAAPPIGDYAQPLMAPPGGATTLNIGIDGGYHRFGGLTRCFYHPALAYGRVSCAPQSTNYIDTEHFDLWALAETMMYAQSGGLVTSLQDVEQTTHLRLRLQAVLVRDTDFAQTYNASNPYPDSGTDTTGSASPPGLAEWHETTPGEPPTIILSTFLEFDLVLVGPAGTKHGYLVNAPVVEDLLMDDTDNSVELRMIGRDADAAVRVRRPDGTSFWCPVGASGPGRGRIVLPPSTPPEQIYKIVEIGNSVTASKVLLPGEQIRIFTSDNFLP